MYGLENAGIGRYVTNLVQHLSKIDGKNTYEIILRKKYYDELNFPNKWRKHLIDDRHYSFKEQFSLPQLLNKLQPDVTHFPHFNVPVFYQRSYVVTIHDLSKNRSKGRGSTTLPYPLYWLKRIVYSSVIKRAIHKSKHIIVPTNFVKRDILANYHISSEIINVTYEGVETTPGKVNVINKYKVNKPYFIFTGSAYPHKNLERLVDAIVLLNKQYELEVDLLISSSRSVFTERLEKLISEKKADSYVKLLGFVPDDELYSLYKNSVAFVYPSLMEGFGLPGLEAMSAGTLVLVSDIPVFKEVYEKSAKYFNPYDFTSIGRVMKEAFEVKRTERREIIKRSQSYVKKYNWEKMARETLRVYEQTSSSDESSASL